MIENLPWTFKKLYSKGEPHQLSGQLDLLLQIKKTYYFILQDNAEVIKISKRIIMEGSVLLNFICLSLCRNYTILNSKHSSLHLHNIQLYQLFHYERMFPCIGCLTKQASLLFLFSLVINIKILLLHHFKQYNKF